MNRFYLTNTLSRFFDIRPGEARRVGMMVSLLFFLLAAKFKGANNVGWKSIHLSLRSFPRKRESSLGVLSRLGTNLDARFRGHDDAFLSRDGH